MFAVWLTEKSMGRTTVMGVQKYVVMSQFAFERDYANIPNVMFIGGKYWGAKQRADFIINFNKYYFDTEMNKLVPNVELELI